MEKSITETIKHLEDSLEKVLRSLERIERGLYGDPSNLTDGLIQKQQKLQVEVDGLKQEIAGIKLKNEQQDLLLLTKKSTWKTIGEIGLKIIQWGAVAYLVLKGTFGIDTMFSKLF